jgi:hypothetical protein
MADFLDEKRREIQARLQELKPYVDEYQLLQAADEALGGIGNGTTTGRRASSAPAAAAAPAKTTRRTRRAGSGGRRRASRGGSPTRAAQALDLVRERPGITIPELAQAMGIQQNYLYRVMPGLAEEGKVTKSGRGWHLREGVS